jgi:hypothetical protein
VRTLINPRGSRARYLGPVRLPRLSLGLVAAAGLLALVAAGTASISTQAHTLKAATSTTEASEGGYVPVTPLRLLTATPLGAAGSINLQVTGLGGVPAGAAAAVLNVTATDPTAAGFLTVYAEGDPLPTVSNLNFAAGETVANLVTVGLSSSGMVTVYNYTGSTDVIADVEGYYTSTLPADGAGLFNPLSPYRVFGTLAIGTAIGNDATVPVTVAAGGADGVPASATAVVLNVTARFANLPTFLTVYPAGGTLPVTSNLNLTPGSQAVANRVTVGVTGGAIDVYNQEGTVDVDVDVDGYYSGSGGSGSPFVPITPIRLADTVAGGTEVGTETPIPADGQSPASTETFTLATPEIPANAAGVAMNLTVVPGDAPGYLTSYPTSDATPPVASDVNWIADQLPAVPNFTIADTTGTGTAQNVEVANSYFTTGATVNVIIDAFGYFGSAPTTLISLSTASSGTGELAEGDVLQVTFNQPASLTAAAFSLTLSDGTNEGTINNSNATAALSSNGLTVTYTITGAVVGTPTDPSLLNLEAVSQTGVSNPVGPWNLPGSANGGADPGVASASGENRVFNGSNTALINPTLWIWPNSPPEVVVAPSFSAIAGSSTVTVGFCAGTDAITVYNSNGVSLGTGTCLEPEGIAQVTLSSAPTAGEALLVTQSYLNGYESIASEGTVAAPLTALPTTAFAAVTTEGTGNASGDTATWTGGSGDYALTLSDFATFSAGQVTVRPYTLVAATSGTGGVTAGDALAVFDVSGTYYYVDLTTESPGPGGGDTAWVGIEFTNTGGTVSLTFGGSPDGNAAATDTFYYPLATGTTGDSFLLGGWTPVAAQTLPITVVATGAGGALTAGSYDLTVTIP